MNWPALTLAASTNVLPSAAAALAVCGNRKIAEPAAQVGAVTVVVVTPGVSVTLPVAFERPSISCRTAKTILKTSFSCGEMAMPLMEFPFGEDAAEIAGVARSPLRLQIGLELLWVHSLVCAGARASAWHKRPGRTE